MNLHNVIIGNSRFSSLAGSEITTLELADEFSLRGAEVAIASYEFGGEITSLAEQAGHRLIDLSRTNLSDEIFDLAWIHHPPTYYGIFLECKARARTVVYSSLSHFEPLESPPIPITPINRFLANSEENLQYVRDTYPEFRSHFDLFPNAAPRQFWQNCSREPPPMLRTIAVVSNHPPDELLDAVNLLKKRSIAVDIYGSHGTATRITAAILDRYDAVITIGKTIQYCLARCIPVFCYDYFGGPGWIVPDNANKASSKNFSGRCTRQKIDSVDIVERIFAGYLPTLSATAELRKLAEAQFCLQRNLDRVLLAIDESPPCLVSNTHSATTANILARHNAIYIRERKSQLLQIAHYQDVLEKVTNSYSWRITTPFRAIQQIFRRWLHKAHSFWYLSRENRISRARTTSDPHQ